MASGSVIAAVMLVKYPSLTAGLFPGGTLPSIWLGEAPQEDGTGAQLRPPYVIVDDMGGKPEWAFGTNAIINGNFALEVFYVSLADCDTAMNAILWNGSIPSNRAGLAFAVLDLASPLKGITVVPEQDQHSYAGFVNFDGSPVHKLRQEFSSQSALGGSGY